jgi:putative zinc finger/helix-turn-helix YgiT family protein
MQEHLVDIIEREESETFNGLKVNFNAVYEYCLNTDELIETEELIKANGLAVKDAYRKASGLLTSAEIRKIREKYDISQKELSGILGWGKATITRYENHQVQTRAHDNILRKIDSDPQWFLEMLNRVKGKISEKLFIRYFKAAYEQYRNSLNKSINSLYKSIEINTVVDILEILPGDTYTEICSRNSFKNRCRISSLWEYPADKSYKAEPLLSV